MLFRSNINGIGKNDFLPRLYRLLRQMDGDWQKMLPAVPHVTQTSGDPHDTLMKVLGLNADSVEFYQRVAESATELQNRMKFRRAGKSRLKPITPQTYAASGMELLAAFGVTPEEIPDILTKFFLKQANRLQGDIVDDLPASEKMPVRAYTTDGRNYLQWLADAARHSHNTLRRQDGFIDEAVPTALLYLTLHHALDMSFVDTSLDLKVRAGKMSLAQLKTAKRDSPFLHVEKSKKVSESKWVSLYERDASITNDPTLTIGDYIPKVLFTLEVNSYLTAQLRALDILKDVSTARLERAFTEHIDLLSFRLDGWKNGLFAYQLSLMRQKRQGEKEEHAQGTYLGAYGWLEDVRPTKKTLRTQRITDSVLEKIFQTEAENPLLKDSTNGGFLLAPSLNHAVTASILRNGYIAAFDDPATPANEANPEQLRINLSSERVRMALGIIEGMRQGQSLGALLGYQFERGLHEGHDAELDFIILPMRKAFPLVANKMIETEVTATTETTLESVEAIEASNVVDGDLLVKHIRDTGKKTYPYGKDNELPKKSDLSQAQWQAVDFEIDRIMNIADAVADVGMAESVHQIVQGNYDRGAATLDAFSKGTFPQIPDVVQTPDNGTVLTHRVGLQLKSGIDTSAITNNVRAIAEPAMNDWLQTMLPAFNTVFCKVTYTRNFALEESEFFLSELNLQPIDVLYILNNDSEQAMTELDDRILANILSRGGVRPDSEIKISYLQEADGLVSFFELTPLVKSLRQLLLRSRALVPGDVLLPSAAAQNVDEAQLIDAARLKRPLAMLKGIVDPQLRGFTEGLNLLAKTEEVDDVTIASNNAAMLDGMDANMAKLDIILRGLQPFGIPQTGNGFLFDKKRELFRSIFTLLAEKVQKMEEHKAAYDGLLLVYNANIPATEDDRINALLKARQELTASVVAIEPLNAAALLAEMTSVRTAYQNKITELESFRQTPIADFNQLLTEAEQLFAGWYFTEAPADFTALKNTVVLFGAELAQRASGLLADVSTRITKATALVEEAELLPPGKKRITAQLEAAKQLFGEEFRMLPEFTLPAVNAEELAKTYNDQASLLTHQTATLQNEFPLDEWMYGVARVREKMGHWENAMLLSEAFGGNEATFSPLQLPYKAGDSWLALPFPKEATPDSDRLLYTAHFADGYDKTRAQCGLLLDEWTEVIPAQEKTAGIAFHFDRPNAEPPQAMLLAMPSQFQGAWQWQDLVDTLHETLDAAKKRAIEPAQIAATSYARFLPAVISSVTNWPISSSLNYGFNNNVHLSLINPTQP